MALTRFQRHIVGIIADNRRQAGSGCLAGRATVNAFLDAPRASADVDVFHDTADAVHATFESDRAAFVSSGLKVTVLREWPAFVEAAVEFEEDGTRLQWAHDSAFRFYGLVDHPEMGLALHPFDLATNKVLALVGRAEPRDWVDIIECDARLQPLGYLAWAAAGKDPGLNPAFILDQAARSGRYTEEELAPLAFEGERPTAAELAARWKGALATAREVIEALPPREAGTCVCGASGARLLLANPDALRAALRAGEVRFRPGALGRAFPRLA